MDKDDSKLIKKDNNLLFNKELNGENKKTVQIKIIDLKTPILKIIFSFLNGLNEGKKLKIIKNNKKLQKKLDVNIRNYKQFSWRYKIGERNGKGKEYCNN